MTGRIKRPFTVIAATTMALMLAAPATAALAKAAPAGKGGGSGTAAAAAAAAKGGGSGTKEGTGGTGSSSSNKGSANKGGTTKKGTTFADLIMVLRDDTGVPIVNGQNCVQPITYTPIGTAANVAKMYSYDVPVYLIPLVGGTDLAVACDIQAGYTAIETDLGRLSVGRSPESVLTKQLTDVTAALTGQALTLDASGRIVANDAAIDSPLQNLAIYQSLLEKATLAGATLPIGGLGYMPLAAAAFAAAADKTTVQTIDAVQYLNRILKIPADTALATLPAFGLQEQYLSFAGFSYNRSAMFPGNISYWDLTGTVPVLVEGTIIEEVFGGVGGRNLSDAKAFASMVDDARMVLLFVHDHTEVFVDSIGMTS